MRTPVHSNARRDPWGRPTAFFAFVCLLFTSGWSAGADVGPSPRVKLVPLSFRVDNASAFPAYVFFAWPLRAGRDAPAGSRMIPVDSVGRLNLDGKLDEYELVAMRASAFSPEAAAVAFLASPQAQHADVFHCDVWMRKNNWVPETSPAVRTEVVLHIKSLAGGRIETERTAVISTWPDGSLHEDKAPEAAPAGPARPLAPLLAPTRPLWKTLVLIVVVALAWALLLQVVKRAGRRRRR